MAVGCTAGASMSHSTAAQSRQHRAAPLPGTACTQLLCSVCTHGRINLVPDAKTSEPEFVTRGKQNKTESCVFPSFQACWKAAMQLGSVHCMVLWAAPQENQCAPSCAEARASPFGVTGDLGDKLVLLMTVSHPLLRPLKK